MLDDKKYYLLSLACGLLAIGAVVFTFISLGNWYIDDAGISLAYARNLARDGVLTAQIGDSPVEGYSNPLWVAIHAIICIITGHPNLLQTRIVGMFVLILCYIRIIYVFVKHGKAFFQWSLCFALTMLQPSVIIYSLSGLENSLLVYFALELLIQAYKGKKRSLFISSVVVSGLALTRPDAIVYLFFIPMIILLESGSSRQKIKQIVRVTILPIIVIGAHLAFRLVYFGRLHPNTYYAKALPVCESLLRLLKFDYDIQRNLFEATISAFGQAGAWIILFGIVWALFSNTKAPLFTTQILPAALISAMAAFCFAYLPTDWMPLFRFATIYFLGLYSVTAHVICDKLDLRKGILLSAILMVSCTVGCFNGVRRFVRESPVSTAEVSSRGAYFATWGKLIGKDKPSLLTADAGGILLDEHVRLVDLGMLCNAKIADALGHVNEQPDRDSFFDYILEEVKPTFIATRAFHSYLACLDKDARFRRDYVPIHEYVDTWILNRYGVIVMSGDYVRKDAMAGDPNAFKLMKKQSQGIYYPFDNKHLLCKTKENQQ